MPRLKSFSDKLEGAVVLDKVEHVSSLSSMSVALQHDDPPQEIMRLLSQAEDILDLRSRRAPASGTAGGMSSMLGSCKPGGGRNSPGGGGTA